MCHSGEYGRLLNHQSATITMSSITDDSAEFLVDLVDHAGANVAFKWELTKQTAEPFVDCWMTDAVYPAPATRPAQAV
jgi:hypothetical protein